MRINVAIVEDDTDIRQSLEEIINGRKALQFRRELDMDKNETCRRCVCYLNLPASVNPVKVQ